MEIRYDKGKSLTRGNKGESLIREDRGKSLIKENPLPEPPPRPHFSLGRGVFEGPGDGS